MVSFITHPEQGGLLHVVQRQLEVYQKDKWIILKESENALIAKDTSHTYRSRHFEDRVFEYTLSPIRHFSEMMRPFENSRMKEDERH